MQFAFLSLYSNNGESKRFFRVLVSVYDAPERHTTAEQSSSLVTVPRNRHRRRCCWSNWLRFLR